MAGCPEGLSTGGATSEQGHQLCDVCQGANTRGEQYREWRAGNKCGLEQRARGTDADLTGRAPGSMARLPYGLAFTAPAPNLPAPMAPMACAVPGLQGQEAEQGREGLPALGL